MSPERSNRNVYSQEAVKHFFELAKKRTKLYPGLVLAATMGLRRGEILGLRIRDIDLDKGFLVIKQTIVQTRSGVKVKTTKSRHSNRTLSIPYSVHPIL